MGKFSQCLTELSAYDTIMAGYYSLMFLFSLREGVRAKVLWPEEFASASENLANKVQKIIFIFFKTISYLTGHLSISVICYFLSFLRHAGVGG